MMPTDTRRINGPEDARCPHVFTKVPLIPLVNENGRRLDGRAADKVRPIFLKVGVVSQARGSAYIELEKTKVICAVYGPRQVRQDDFSLTGQISCEFKFAPFSCHSRKDYQQDSLEKNYSTIVQQALESAVCLDKFPKAQLDVFITVLENDGSVVGAAIMAASLAVTDAGLDMYDVLVACSLRQHADMFLMDPTLHEENTTETSGTKTTPGGLLTVGLMPNMNQVSALYQTGEMTGQSLTQATNTCIEYCQKLYPVVQHCLVSSVQDRFTQVT